MGAALGMSLAEGDVAVSIGTSGTAYAVTSAMTADPSGLVSGFADATGRFLPLVATLNAARVLGVTARMLGVDTAGLSDLALKAEAGAGGLVLLPYLDGERTPNRPSANGVLRGLTTSNATPENLARAAVEAVLCSLADAIDCLRPCGITPGPDRAHRRRGQVGGGADDRARGVRPAGAWCRRRPSTWRSAPRARRPGRCPATPSLRRGRPGRRSPLRLPRRPGCASSTAPCVTTRPRGRRPYQCPARCRVPLGGCGCNGHGDGRARITSRQKTGLG